MARPHPSDDGHTLVNSTVVAIDKDKNSHYAVRWAVDHLFNMVNNAKMILVHVRLKNSNRRYLLLIFFFSNHTQIASSKLDELRNVVADGGNIDDNELNQLFVPYRGYCARKGVYFLIQAFPRNLICYKSLSNCFFCLAIV